MDQQEWDEREKLREEIARLREAAERAYGECDWEFNQRGSWGPLSNEAVEALRAALTPPPTGPKENRV